MTAARPRWRAVVQCCWSHQCGGVRRASLSAGGAIHSMLTRMGSRRDGVAEATAATLSSSPWLLARPPIKRPHGALRMPSEVGVAVYRGVGGVRWSRHARQSAQYHAWRGCSASTPPARRIGQTPRAQHGIGGDRRADQGNSLRHEVVPPLLLGCPIGFPTSRPGSLLARPRVTANGNDHTPKRVRCQDVRDQRACIVEGAPT